MSIFSTISEAVAVFKADTSDMEAGLKKLTGVEKEHQKAILDTAKERNSSYDGWIKKLGDTNQALELMGKGVAFAKESFKAYADHLKLSAAAGSADIEKLRAASLGLRTEHELLSFAAKTQSGIIRVSQADMETAQKAMVALTRAGFDQAQVTDKITNALVKAKSEGLDDFGLSIKAGKTDLENYTNLMAALAQKAGGVREGQLTAGESVERLGVSMQESIDKMKIALGELVAALAPLLEALAAGVGLIGDIAAASLKGSDPMAAAAQALATQQRILDAIAGGGSQSDMMARYAKAKGVEGRKPVNAYDRWNNDELGGMDEGSYASFMRKRGLMGDQGKEADALDWGNWGGMGASGTGADAIRGGTGKSYAAIGQAFDELLGRLSAHKEEGVDSRTPAEIFKAEYGIDLEASMSFGGGTKSGTALDLEERKAGQRSFLESTFGKLEDFNAYATAFGMLTGSVTSAMDAWITGSMSAGDAVKAFIGQALKGLASQMAIEALKHGAYAIGSLAFGDLRGAGTHAAAAGAFGAAAAAAAVAAREFGGGASASGGGAGGRDHRGAGGSAGGGGSSGGSVDSPGSGSHDSEGLRKESVVIVYADPFADGSPTQRRQNAERFAQRALSQSSARR